MAENRKSDTKSVVLNYERDSRLLDHLKTLKVESEFWRIAGYFYLDFFEWLALQPGAPVPGRPFVYYRQFLESQAGHIVNPEEIAAAILPSIRQIVEAALASASLAPSSGRLPTLEEQLDLATLMSADLILE